jgi:hypothetical protein
VQNAKRYLLKSLSVDEISLVHKDSLPANQGANVLLTKVFRPGTAEEGNLTKPEILKALLNVFGIGKEDVQKLNEEVGTMTLEELTKAFNELKAKSDVGETIAKLSIDISKTVKLAELDTLAAEVAKLDQKDNRVVFLNTQLTEARKAANSGKAEHFKQNKLPKAQHAAFDALSPKDQSDFMDAHEAANGNNDDGSDDGNDDGSDDGEDSATEKMFKMFLEKHDFAPVVKLQQKVAKQEAIIADMQKREAVTKIKTETLGDVKGVQKDLLAESIYKLQQTDPLAVEHLVKTIKAQAVQIEKGGLFSELGKLGMGDANSATYQFQNLVKTIAKEQNISEAKATEKAMLQSPDIYKLMQKEGAAQS